MDKHGNRFLDDNQETTKIIDLDEANVKEEFGAEEDIDTLYEENEKASSDSVDEPTKIINNDKKSDSPKRSKKSNKEIKREEQLKEKNAKKLEKLMKKKQKREKKSDRKALPYEDMPPDESVDTHHKKPAKLSNKRIIAIVLILVIVFGAVFVFANSDKMSWHNIRNYVKYGILNQNSDESFPISVQGDNVDIGNFVRMGQDICYASDTKMQIINNYGRTEYTTQHGFTNPVLSACERYALTFSLGGTGFQVSNYDSTVYTGDTEERLLTADIIDNGTYALVTTGNGYLSKMQVFDKENEKIFGYSFADYYVTSVSLAPNGKAAVVTGLSALNGSEISSIYVLDFTKDKPVYIEELTDNIFYDIQYLNDTYAAAVGSAAVCTINTKSGDVNKTMYNGSHLTSYAFNRDTDNFSISISHSGDGRNCEILSFKTNGQLSESFETEYMVKCISTYKGRVALLTPDVIYLYSKSGEFVSQKEISNEPLAIVLYTTSDAYVLDTNEISALPI